MKSIGIRKRAGFSLMELLAVVTILGIIAAIIVPRVAVSSDTAKTKVNTHNKATINAAVERWYIEKGAWPANNLSDIGADVELLPGWHSGQPDERHRLHAERHDAPRQLTWSAQPISVDLNWDTQS